MADGSTPTKRTSDLLKGVEIMILANVCIVAFYAASKGCTTFWQVLQTLAVAVGISAASLMVGGLFGFLFSIPRAAAKNQQIDYDDNSNLVDISDWLTKILVGAGLVTLTKIPPKLELLGHYLGTNGFNDEKDGQVFSLILVVFSSVCGFLWVYVWTRLNFAHDLAHARDEQLTMALKAARESPVSGLLLQALSLPRSSKDADSEALRKQAQFMGRTQLKEDPASRKIAIQYSRLLDEQFNDRKGAIETLTATLKARRDSKIPPDADDAALDYNLACYVNLGAREATDAAVKKQSQTQATDYLREAIKLDPSNEGEAKGDSDLNDLSV